MRLLPRDDKFFELFTAQVKIIRDAAHEFHRALSGDSGRRHEMAETMAVLRDGLASDVLVADDPTSTATAWIGPQPEDLAASDAELRERGIDQPTEDRADAALVRAVACTGAELWFVPEGEPPPRAGIGALLRYAAPQS